MLGFYLTLLDTAEEKRIFSDLYLKYRDAMYNCAYKILKDSYLAEDAVHNAFISLTKSLNKINSMNCNEIRNYLLIISRNASFAIYKDNQKNLCSDIDEEIILADDDVEVDIEMNECKDKIFNLAKGLDKNYSDVLILKLFYDMPDIEIAKSLNITVENVRVRFFRGKLKLKELLEKEGLHDEQGIWECNTGSL